MKLLTLDDTIPNSRKYSGQKVKNIVDNSDSQKYLKWWLSRNRDFKLHNKTIKYIIERTNLGNSDDFIILLKSMGDNKVAKLVLELNSRGNFHSIFTDIRPKDSSIYVTFNTPFGNKNNKIRVGKLVNKLLSLNNITDYTKEDLENFSNDYYSETINVVNGKPIGNYPLEVIDGNKIKWAYHEDNYISRGGTLGNSCERHPYRQDNLTCYTKNKTAVKLLVLLDTKRNKVMARALLWDSVNIINSWLVSEGESELSTGGGYKFMDRIYTSNPKLEAIFHKYADTHGYIKKRYQRHSEYTTFKYKGNFYNLKIETDLKNINVLFPYMDTFKRRKTVSKGKGEVIRIANYSIT